MAGALRLGRERRAELLELIELMLNDMNEIVPVNREVASAYAELRADLERRGQTPSRNDAWIAATAMAYEFTLVAHDTDFQRIHGLRLEDWYEV